MSKRVISFILTFAAGLIVASFFVSIMPSFSLECGKKRHRKHQMEEQLRIENDRLNQDNQRLREINERLTMEKMNADDINFDFDVPPPPPPPATVPRSR